MNDAVTPLGKSDVTARFTLPENPVCGVIVMVLVTEVPGAKVKAAGEAPRIKPGAGLTVRNTVATAAWEPLFPTTDIV